MKVLDLLSLIGIFALPTAVYADAVPEVAPPIEPSVKAEDVWTEGFFLELVFGFAATDHSGDYHDRLQAFGFEPESGFFGSSDEGVLRYSIAAGRRLHPNFAAGFQYANLDDGHYVRDNDRLEQQLLWESSALGVFAQGDVSAGYHRKANIFARAGFGLTFATTTFDEILSESQDADSDPSFDNTKVRTQQSEESFTRYYLAIGAGITVMPWDLLGFQIECSYVLAPAIESELGDTQDVGGFTYFTGLRLRSWE